MAKQSLLPILLACAATFSAPVALTEVAQAQVTEADSLAMGALQREMQTQLDAEDYHAAIRSGEALLERIAATLGRESREYAFNASQLALIGQRVGDAGLVDRLYDDALAGDWRSLPVDMAYDLLAEASRFRLLMGESEQSIDLNRQATALLDSNGISAPEHRAHLQGNLAIALIMSGRNADATPILEDLLEIMTGLYGRDAPLTLQTQHNLAASYGRVGMAELSRAQLLDVYERRARTLGEEHTDTLNSLNDLALAYSSQGNRDDAERILRQVHAARQRVMGAEHKDTMDTLENLAELLHESGRSEESLAMFAQVSETNRRLLGPTHPEVVRPAVNRARVLEELGRVDEASQLYAMHLTELDEAGLGDTLNAAGIAFSLGNLLQDQGDPASLPLLERSYRNLQGLLGQSHESLVVASANYAAGLLGDPARHGEALEPAEVALADALGRRMSLYSASLRPEDLARLAGDARMVGQTFADALWAATEGEIDPGQVEQLIAALQLELETPASEASKRAVLRVAASRGGGELSQLMEQREQLQRRRATNEEQLGDALSENASSSETLQALNRERVTIEGEIAALDARLRAEFPEYFTILSPALARADEIAAVLRPEEVAIMLVPAEHGTHVVAITREDVRWHRSALGSAAIARQVRRLLWFAGGQVSATPGEESEWLAVVDGGLDGFDRDSAHALYRELFGPLEDLLADKDEWLLAPGGDLASLPFAVLVTEPPTGLDDAPADLRATSWLIDRTALVQLPSLQMLLHARRMASAEQATGTGRLVAFGNPVLAGSAATRGMRGGSVAEIVELGALPADNALADPDMLRRLSSLPGTATEINALSAAVGAERALVFLAEDATETAIKQADLTAAQTLILATHGLLADEIRGLSEPGLVFTPPDTATPLDDGYLSASEVIELRLGSDWVILSACNTAAPGSAGATALSGLARAFFFAGAQSLLVSHWLVRDDVAPMITVGLVGDAASERNRAQALREAMIAVRDDSSMDDASFNGLSSTFAHPSAWAPFIMVSGS